MQVLDVHGRPVSMIRITGSSLVKAQQWIEFLDEYAPQFAKEQPWVTLLVTAVVNLHQSFVIQSRRLRKNDFWTGGGTMADDTRPLIQDAEERLAWFEKNSEQVDQTLLPEWAKFLFASVQGGFRMQVRLAKECTDIARRGYSVLHLDRRGDVIQKRDELGEEVEA